MDIPPPKNPNPRNNAFPNVLNFELWVFKVVYCKKNTTVPISCNSDINVNREDWHQKTYSYVLMVLKNIFIYMEK